MPLSCGGRGLRVDAQLQAGFVAPASNLAVGYELVQRDIPGTAIRSSLALKSPLYCDFFASSYKVDWCLCPLLSP